MSRRPEPAPSADAAQVPAASPAAVQTGSATLKPLLSVACQYLPEADIRRIREAFRFSDEAHLGQFRSSGEPYITHPVAVATLCAEWRLDAAALMAALLHDTLEDTAAQKPELIKRFGTAVAEMVDGLSKLDRLKFDSREQAQAESFRKMLLAMARDVRVILIKLADRTHNMRTLGAVAPDKGRRIARETMEIYAPIANRLGLNTLYRELQDLSFAAQYPYRHRALGKAVRNSGKVRRDSFGRVVGTIQAALLSFGVSAELSSREKSLYSIYRKMRDKRISFSEVNDLFGVRLIVPDIAQCYLALGALHSAFKPNTSRFKDFIAIAKVNGYQSLHTTVMGPHGGAVEVQIRTPQMHQLAESGVAAHWLYKSELESATDVQMKALAWLKSLLDIQQQTGDPMEFIEHVKVDLYPDAVYVFTPRGDIRGLPRGATVVDFAYSVHTDVGNHAIGATINGDPVLLRTELSHGDVVEIATDPDALPSPSWLGFARTGKARSEIRYFLRRTRHEESVELGRRLLSQALMPLRVELDRVELATLERAARDSASRSVPDLFADIGLGLKMAAVVARSIAMDRPVDTATAKFASRPQAMTISQVDGISVLCAPCCHPVPGDRILGHMRGGHGLVLHRSECEQARRNSGRDAERWIDVEWSDPVKGTFRVQVVIAATDEMGVLGRIAGEIAAHEANIAQVAMEADRDQSAIVRFTLLVRDRHHLAQVFRGLRRLPQVRALARH